jgi:hypothetical protein
MVGFAGSWDHRGMFQRLHDAQGERHGMLGDDVGDRKRSRDAGMIPKKAEGNSVIAR